METERKMFGGALSCMESFDACMASLSSEKTEEEGGAGRDELVKTLTETWLELKRNLKSVFSQKEDEIRHLQCALEKAGFAAEDHIGGLRSESREDVTRVSPQDGHSSDLDPNLVEPKAFPELGRKGLDSRLPDRNVVETGLEQEEAPHSEKHEIASHSSEAGLEPEQDSEPHSKEQEVVVHASVTGMEQEQEVALHSEMQGITDHTRETGMPPEAEVLPHSKEQGVANHAGMETEIDSVSSQQQIGTETASAKNLGTFELAGKTVSNSGPGSSNDQIRGQESQNEGMEIQESTPDGTSVSEESSEYQKVEYAVLFYHRSTGYYYDPATQLFYTPVTSDQQYAQSSDQQGESQTTSAGATWGDYVSGTASDGQTSDAGQTGSVAEMLAAASDRVMERCGYSYNDSVGMYYDSRLGLYYDQESKLYYDPDRGTYYYFDPETRQYSVHSRVKLPAKTEEKMESEADRNKEEVIDLCSSEEEFADSPEEGEIRPRKRPRLPPRLPHGSPPPEDEWDPCIRMVISTSECLPEGTLFVVTQDGASIGREPSGPHGIKVPEVQVSKSHASITYSKRKQRFTIKDEGSANGTFLNQKRLSEARESSKSRPLSHGHTLTLGTTTFNVHIHTGWETCEECDPALLGGEGGRDGGGGGGAGESLDLLRRRELNRIKKRYGLRAKDTYGEKEVQLAESYKDRASTRRKKVGSEPLEFHRPDDPPASVHRPLSGENRGHKMLVKMGWQEGQGLGKDNTGVAEPIQTKVRTEKVGLGSNFSTRSLEAASTHSATQRHHRMMRHFSDVISREKAQKSKLKGKSGSVDIFVE